MSFDVCIARFWKKDQELIRTGCCHEVQCAVDGRPVAREMSLVKRTDKEGRDSQRYKGGGLDGMMCRSRSSP
jgi:hypothetical protein